ncbi:head-tail connector protein [Parasphingopyxis sp.]|uniref:head-tail connector protein n=1 Tax=Parasphingopyxis sp. TaxID=1920299 RepID=UPI0026060C65|nr:head-tail connector protein [Parasphingopyxis sp.]
MAAVEDVPAATAVALDTVKADLRIATDEDDALLAGLIRTATGVCERFVGRALLLRDAEETIPVSSEWRRLTLTPVAAITGITGLPETGDPFALPIDSYAIDIDSNGDGWVRVTAAGQARRVTVAYRAGMGPDWNAVPEPLRQGIVRLVAHLFTERDADETAGPPAAVVALWRPWRRMRLQ